MANINPVVNDRVRYTLLCKNLETLIITEPIGWVDDEKEYTRHEQYHGIITKFSNSLKFIGTGAEYIQIILDLYGINEQVKLTREEKHPQTDIWVLTYSGYLDLSTWATENNQVSLKFNSGGLEQLLKSRENEKVEIDRLTSIDGVALPPINTIDVELEGRRIFLKSQLESKAIDNTYLQLLRVSADGNFRSQTAAIPLKIVTKSHEEISEIYFGAISDDKNVGVSSQMIFFRANRDKSVKIKIVDLIFTTDMYQDINIYSNDGPAHYRVSLCVYDANYNIKSRTNLYYCGLDDFPQKLGSSNPAVHGTKPSDYVPPQTHKINYEAVIALNFNDNISLECAIEGNVGTFDIYTKNITGKVFFEENSFFEKTNAKAILAHEFIERLATIATNTNNCFYSDFLGRKDLNYLNDGKAAYNAFTHGFWVRKFDKEPLSNESNINLFKPLTTSFKDAVQSLDAVWNIGIGIEKVGFNERIRLEELSYFYNRNVTIKLPNQIKNVKRTIAVDKYYSALEFGYNEGGDYEEACGLDEYNAKSNFTTVINRLKNTYSKISEYRADSYGLEFTRRKQKSLNDTEDTSRDNSIWFLDLKKGFTALFQQRKWQDDFNQEPSGVFSPETATNLRLSPINCLLRHSWWFSAGLKKYLSDKVRYGSSTANSQLKTKLLVTSGGNDNEYSENGNIINSELKTPRFLPEEIEFEHVCDFDILQQINGYTTILNKNIRNFYGLVEFVNENNEIEKGFLMNLKPNGRGSWKILKYNR